jgi:RNA polymerase sigma factor (sigma-70 family)
VSTGRITAELQGIGSSKEAERAEALERLLNHTLQALHRIAQNKLSRERSSTRPTRLVNDLVPELMRHRKSFNDRQHFFAWAKRQFDRIYIGYRRTEDALKRGGGNRPEPLDESIPAPGGRLGPELRMDLQRAIEKLPDQQREFLALLAEGYTLAKAAEMAGVPPGSAAYRRQLIYAKLARTLDHELE